MIEKKSAPGPKMRVYNIKINSPSLRTISFRTFFFFSSLKFESSLWYVTLDKKKKKKGENIKNKE